MAGGIWLTFTQSQVAIIVAFVVSYVVALAVYRLYLSPLAEIPGPELAAVTLWYEFYYDVIKRGRYTWEIGRMHEKYGRLQMLLCITDATHVH